MTSIKTVPQEAIILLEIVSYYVEYNEISVGRSYTCNLLVAIILLKEIEKNSKLHFKI